MQHILTRIKIKPGKTQVVCEFLVKMEQENQNDMRAILSESGLHLDCSFIDTIGGEDYLFVFKTLKDLVHLKKNIKGSQDPFWQGVRDWMGECLDETRVDLPALSVFEV